MTVDYLRTARAVRERCAIIREAARGGGLAHFAVEEARLGPCADAVVATIRVDYPALDVPYHSRWRHFAAGGVDRWAALAARWPDPARRGRAAVELAVVSVLLDAGVGAEWRYVEDGREWRRSEGLAVASLRWFAGGMPPLQHVSTGDLAAAFQVRGDNPLVGVEGRAALLRRLGEVCEGDVGTLFDRLAARGEIAAGEILAVLLRTLGRIWPGRLTMDGVPLGDAWRHPAIPGDGIVPFHKLSQWLAYSLIEPLEAAGVRVTGLDELTGLPEYRNGGLLLDTGVLLPKHARVLEGAHTVDSEIVVEWRALTVALLDELAAEVRRRLGFGAEEFPLAKVLQGGTWSAGRRIARERRPGAEPPLTVLSDGTVF